MDVRRSPYSSQPEGGQSFNLQAVPLMCRDYDDSQLENGNSRSTRSSQDLGLAHSKGGSAATSSTESFPDIEDYPPRSPYSRSRWSLFSSLRLVPYAWARRLRIGTESVSNGQFLGLQPVGRRRRTLHYILFLVALTLMMLGVIQFLSITFGVFAAFFPDDLDWVIDHWGDPGQPSEGLAHWPTDFTGDIKPIACHSHNDYWRKVPLYEAIQAGCIGVEADVWLFDEELYVGHNTYSLTPNRTLKSLYIEPLLEILGKQNPITHFNPDPDMPPHGVFDTEPDQTLILLIDFKTAGNDLWPYVVSQLQPFRDHNYLTYFNGTDVIQGPITVVGTGNTPFDLLMSNVTYRDIFFDAPLDQMASQDTDLAFHPPEFDMDDSDPDFDGESIDSKPFKRSDQGPDHSSSAPTDPNIYSELNSYYASVDFKRSIGHVWRYRLSVSQLDKIRAQIRGAHQRGLKVRYWGLPSWPRGLRNHVWHVLVREGVDILNVDDLMGATRRDWRRRKGWWY